jgi:dTDP-4-amino-4,6-dideoxygalactose transaminase
VIRLSRPYFSSHEADAVAETLASAMLIQGARVAAFEEAVCTHLARHPYAPSVRHAIAVCNGTAALELAVATIPIAGNRRLCARDEVIVPAVSWPSPGHAVALEGATPVLVDVDLDTWCLEATAVEAAITPHTVAIIAIDQFGVPAQIPALRARYRGLDLIEDSACALGASLDGVPCGMLGDVGIHSFHPRKVITTGEGGMLTTADTARAARLRMLRNHGQSSPGVFEDAGPNARMSEIHAAVGVVQMSKLDAMLARRRAIAEEVRAAVGLHWQAAPAGAVVNHQTLGFVLPMPAQGTRRAARDALLSALREAGVEANILSYALHQLPQFAAYAVNRTRRFPVADVVVDGGVAVPLHPAMSADDVAVVIDRLRTHAAWALGREVLA